MYMCSTYMCSCVYIYIYFYVNTYMELDTTLLNTQHIRYGSRVKWSNPGNGVAPSPTPWCSSYRKGSLRVTLDYGR